MSCAPPTFFILLETGSYLLQEDATSRVQLEVATTTGHTICAAHIGPTAQLFPPTVRHSSVPIDPSRRACPSPVALPRVPVFASVRPPARGPDLVAAAAPHLPPTLATPPAAPTPPAQTTRRVCTGASNFPIG